MFYIYVLQYIYNNYIYNIYIYITITFFTAEISQVAIPRFKKYIHMDLTSCGIYAILVLMLL